MALQGVFRSDPADNSELLDGFDNLDFAKLASANIFTALQTFLSNASEPVEQLYFENTNTDAGAGQKIRFRNRVGTAQNEAAIVVDSPNINDTRVRFQTEVDGGGLVTRLEINTEGIIVAAGKLTANDIETTDDITSGRDLVATRNLIVTGSSATVDGSEIVTEGKVQQISSVKTFTTNQVFSYDGGAEAARMLFFHNLNQSEDAGTELYFRTSTGTAQNDASILVDCPSEGFTRFVFSNEVDGVLEERFMIYEQTLYSKGRYFILEPPGNHSAQINFVDLNHGLLKYEQDNDALTIKSLPAGGSVVLSTDSYFVRLDDNGALVDPSNKHFRADVLNVKFFGATGDGVTDDTSAIQDALDTAGESSIVWFPAGEYLISSPLNVSYSGQKILGEVRSGTILIADGAFAGQGEGMIEIDNGIDVIEIGNLYLKCGNYADYGIYGPGVSSSQNGWYLHDLTIRTPATCGIKASNFIASYERIRVSEGNGFYLGAVDGGYEGTNITLKQCFVVQDDLVNSYTAYQFKQIQGWTMIGCASDKSNLYLKIEDGGYGIMLGCDGESNRALLDQTGTNANTTLKNCRIWVLGDTVTPATNLLFYRGILSIENSDIDVVAGGFTYLFAEDSQTDGLSLTNNTHDFLADPVTYPVNLYAGAYHLTDYSDLNDPNFLTSDFTKTAIDALEVDAGTLDDLNSTQFLRSDQSDTMAGSLSIQAASQQLKLFESGYGDANDFYALSHDENAFRLQWYDDSVPNTSTIFSITNAGNMACDGTLTVAGASGTIDGNTIYHAGNFGKTQIDALEVDAGTLDDHDSTYFATDSLTCHLAGDETITGKKTVRNDIVIETVNGTAAKVLYFDNKTTGVYDFKMYAPNDNSGFTIEALKTNAKLIFNNDGDTLTIAGNTVWNAGNFGKTQIDALGINASSVGNVFVYSGSGSPEGVVTAATGSLYTSTAGGSNTTLYVKESGSGNTGWVAK